MLTEDQERFFASFGFRLMGQASSCHLSMFINRDGRGVLVLEKPGEIPRLFTPVDEPDTPFEDQVRTYFRALVFSGEGSDGEGRG